MTLMPEPPPFRIGAAKAEGSSSLPPWMRRKRFWVLAGLGVLVLVLLVLFGAPTPQDGSTYSRSLTGYRSWYDYMQTQNQPLKRWQKNYDQLTGTGQTLIQVFGKQPAKPIAGEDSFVIQDWVNQGNTLILLSWVNPYCSYDGCPQGEVTAAPFSSRIKGDGESVLIETTRRHQLESGDRSELQDPYGSVVWSESKGKGSIIYATYPWLAANIFAEQPGNYSFLAQLVQASEGTVWVDEWLHGHRDPDPPTAAKAPPPEDLFDYLGRTPVALLVAQSGLLMLLLIWGYNHRFGAAIPLEAPVQDNSEQYIQALGGILNKAGQTEFVLSQLSQVLRQSLATQLGLTQSQPNSALLPEDDYLASQWAAMTGRPAQELLELLEQAGQTRRLSDRELLQWVSQAESILRGLP